MGILDEQRISHLEDFLLFSASVVVATVVLVAVLVCGTTTGGGFRFCEVNTFL